MKKQQRQQAILDWLREQGRPVTGAHLAARFGVSRQVIVKDIDDLRRGGSVIEPTASGYLLAASPIARMVTCRHETRELMERELIAVALEGGTVVDVQVQHARYGALRTELMIATAQDVRRFMDSMRTAQPLAALTGGLHAHTLRAPDEAAMDRILRRLREMGVLIEE